MLTNNTLAKELALLAQESLTNETKIADLQNMVEYLLMSEDLILDDILEIVPKYCDNFEVLDLLDVISEDVSSKKKLVGFDGTNRTVALFVMPIAFMTNEKLPNSAEYPVEAFKFLAAKMKETNVFNHDCDIYLHHHLYTSDQLMNTDYNSVYNLLCQMCNLVFDRPATINAIPDALEEDGNENTIYIRYIIGIRSYKQEADKLDSQDEYKLLTKFNSLAVPIIDKALNSFNTNIVAVDEYYLGIESGLDFHTSVSRRIDLERSMINENVNPPDCVVLIEMNIENMSESMIYLKTHIDDKVIATINAYPLPFHSPKTLIDNICTELDSLNVNLDNVYILNDDKIYPVQIFLEFEEEVEIETRVANFLDNPGTT